jgi:methylated-DNA-[protein]-cysteine S-methyltransferase
MYQSSFAGPFGSLLVFSTKKGIAAIEPETHRAHAMKHLFRYFGEEPITPGDPHGANARLAAYFSGARDAFNGLPLDPRGSSWQLSVWRALLTIPSGTTTSYGALAKKIGRPTAARAVGLANGKNPIMIVVPCHRVIGASGALIGYAGGLPLKEWLLRHESRDAQESRELPDAPEARGSRDAPAEKSGDGHSTRAKAIVVACS